MFSTPTSRFALMAVLGSVALSACSTQMANSRYGAGHGSGYDTVATYESSRYGSEACDTAYSDCGYVQPDPCCVPCCAPVAPQPVYMPPPPPPVYIPEPEPEPPVYVPPAPEPEPEPPVYTPPPPTYYPPAPEPEPYLPPRK